jgi:hypothetical protein
MVALDGSLLNANAGAAPEYRGCWSAAPMDGIVLGFYVFFFFAVRFCLFRTEA